MLKLIFAAAWASLLVSPLSAQENQNPQALRWVPVIALVDIFPSPQQVAFESKASGCRFVGKVGFDDRTQAWVISIDYETCRNGRRAISAQILPGTTGGIPPENAPLLHAGDGALLERKS